MKILLGIIAALFVVFSAHASPLTVDSYPAFVQRPLGSGALCKPGVSPCSSQVTVHDAGGPTSVQVGWLDSAGNPVPGFSGSPGTTVAGGAVTINLGGGPLGGGPFMPYAKDMGTGTVYTGTSTLVGDIWLYGGQSNGENMWAVISASPPTPYSTTKILTGTTWGTPTGDGAITFLNELNLCTGVPQALIAAAIGGTPLTSDGALLAYMAGLTTSLDSWVSTGGAIWSGVMASMNAAHNSIAGVIYHGNESDTLVSRSSVIAQGFFKLRENLQPLVTDRNMADIPFVVVEIGYYHAWDSYGGSEAVPRRGEHLFVEQAPNAFIGAWQFDMPRDFGKVHLTADGLAQVGMRLAHSICGRM